VDYGTIGFIIAIIIMSGAIAYWADMVGKKLGKKRLRFKGLRPKHVASIGTIGLGMMVSALSIGLAMYFSSNLRTVLVRGSGLIRDVEAKQKQLNEVEGQIEKSKNEAKNLEEKNKRLTSENTVVAKNLESQKKLNRELEQDYKKLQFNANLLKAARDMFQAEAKEKRIRVQALEADIKVAKGSLNQLNTNLNAVAQKLKTAEEQMKARVADNRELSSRNVQLEQANSALEKNTEKLQGEFNSLKTKYGEIQLEINSLTEARNTLRTELESTRKQLGQAQDDLAAAKRDLTQVMADRTFLYNIAQNTRTQPMIFRQQEEVSRVNIDPRLNVQRASSAITTLLRTARLKAESRGAKANRSLGFPSAGLFPHEDSKTGRQIGTQEIENDLIRRVAGSEVPLVLIATSSVNTFRGEPVSLEVEVLPNPIVYRAGDVVAEGRIYADQDEMSIFRQVSNFVSGRLRTAAIESKMIPSGDGDSMFGSISPEELLSLLKLLKQQDRLVRLQAVVEKETRAGDPLVITFRVR
jgi:uncharacterized protein (DUF3084 family)